MSYNEASTPKPSTCMDVMEYLRVSKICPYPFNVPLSYPYSHSSKTDIFADYSG